MVPADERLDAQGLLGLEIDDRLIVHDELVADQGLLQVGLNFEALQRARMHERTEELVPGLAGGLRGVHRGVRVPDHLVGVRLSGNAERDPDGRSYEQLPSPDLERNRERRQKAISHSAGARLVGIVLQQDPELVAADPRYRVARPTLELQALGGRDQQLVPSVVPEAVVDRLEAIQVQQEDRRSAARARGTRERVIDAVAEDRAVRQPGERIVERLVRQLLLEELPVGDVARVEHEAFDGRVGHLVAHDALYRPPRSVFVSQPVLRPCRRAGVGRVREVRKDRAEARSVVLVQERQVARPDELLRTHPDQLLR